MVTIDIDNENECKVICKNEQQLSQEEVLKILPALKGKLMLKVAPIRVQKVECYMTPAVKNNILSAHKKLKMYGKKPPIIAHFDDYGFRLPDKIYIDTEEGMELHIVDPVEYGKCYFELRVIKLKPYFELTKNELDSLPF